MSHHAYFHIGDQEKGTLEATTVAIQILGREDAHTPDLLTLSYGLFSVDDARAVSEMASRAPLTGDKKVLIISAPRMFHEAQNALLKLLEEPAPGVTIILVLPSEGILLPTLRSRLLPLPVATTLQETPEVVREFVIATPTVREKLVAKLLERTKSDKEEEKQKARADAITLVSGLLTEAHDARAQCTNEKDREELHLFMRDLETFVPLLYDRSAPLKLIFEHILLVIPTRPFVA